MPQTSVYDLRCGECIPKLKNHDIISAATTVFVVFTRQTDIGSTFIGMNFSSRSNIRHDDGLQRLSISFIDKLHKNLSEILISL